MTELQQFAELRPTDTTFTGDDRATVAEAVFGNPTIYDDDADNVFLLDVPRRDDGPLADEGSMVVVGEATTSGGRRTRALVAAAVIALVGFGAGLVNTVGGGIATVLEATMGTESDPYEPPLIAVSAPGWTTLHSDSSNWPGWEAVFVDPETGLDGGFVGVQITPNDWGIEISAAESIEIDGRPGRIGTEGDLVNLSLDVAGLNQVSLIGLMVNRQQIINLAASLTITDDGSVEQVEPVEGLVPADEAQSEALNRTVSFTFRSDHDTDRPATEDSDFEFETLRVGLLPRGDFWAAVIGAEDGADNEVTLNGETLTVQAEGGNTHRFWVQRGFWVWQVSGDGFDSRDDFLDAFTQATVVDRETWEASFGDAAYEPGDVTSATQAMLADTPVPDGFDVEAHVDRDRPVTPFGLAQGILSGVICAWANHWLDADGRGDDAARQQAVEALETADGWATTKEIEAVTRPDERDLGPGAFVLNSMEAKQVDRVRWESRFVLGCDLS